MKFGLLLKKLIRINLFYASNKIKGGGGVFSRAKSIKRLVKGSSSRDLDHEELVLEKFIVLLLDLIFELTGGRG
jgi:hypothetical protein